MSTLKMGAKTKPCFCSIITKQNAALVTAVRFLMARSVVFSFPEFQATLKGISVETPPPQTSRVQMN